MPQTPTQEYIDQLQEAVRIKQAEVTAIGDKLKEIDEMDLASLSTDRLIELREIVRAARKMLRAHKFDIELYRKEIASFYAPATHVG